MTTSDLASLVGICVSAFGVGWGTGWLFHAVRSLIEKITGVGGL